MKQIHKVIRIERERRSEGESEGETEGEGEVPGYTSYLAARGVKTGDVSISLDSRWLNHWPCQIESLQR